MDLQDKRVALIGAGWVSIQALITFRELQVGSVKCFDAGRSVGGTFSAERAYPGLELQ